MDALQAWPRTSRIESKLLSSQIESAQKKVEEHELRLAQERPQVRRRDEQAARSDLRAAPPRPRGTGPLTRRSSSGSTRSSRTSSRSYTGRLRGGGRRRRGARPPMQALYETDITADELRAEDLGEMSREALIEEFHGRRARRLREERTQEWGPGSSATSSGTSSSRSSTSAGASTSRTWTTSARACTSASMAQKDPLVEYPAEGHVMFEELGGQSARRSCRSSSTRSSSAADEEGEQRPSQAGGNGRLSYEHESARGRRRDRRGRSGSDAGDRWRTTAGGVSASGGPSRRRSRSPSTTTGPQRSVLVRLGQEVQALPRRLSYRHPLPTFQGCVPSSESTCSRSSCRSPQAARTSLYEDRELPLGLGVTNASRIEPSSAGRLVAGRQDGRAPLLVRARPRHATSRSAGRAGPVFATTARAVWFRARSPMDRSHSRGPPAATFSFAVHNR